MTSIKLLGRCLECVVGKRSVKHCRIQKAHTQPKVSPCLKCYNQGYSTSKCRQELHHLDSNGIITLPVYSITPDKSIQSIVSLPQSCQELDSWNISVSVDTDVSSLSNVKYATGYLLEYSEAKFESWYNRYCRQTNTRYSIPTGKQGNTKLEHGTLYINGDYKGYMVKWSKSYKCFRAGKGRLKQEINDSLKRRNAPGSHCCACPAVIRTRLLILDNNKILEIQVPLSSAHENHTPTSIPDQLCNRPLPEIESKIESLINDVRLTPVSLKLAIQDWVKMNLFHNISMKEYLNSHPNHSIVPTFQLIKTCVIWLVMLL